MRLLLDTHTLLWFALDDPQLSRPAYALIIDPAKSSRDKAVTTRGAARKSEANVQTSSQFSPARFSTVPTITSTQVPLGSP